MTGKENITVLLTGATGYLGSYILRALVAAGTYNVLVLKRSTSNTFRIKDYLGEVECYNADEAELEQVFASRKIDVIMHCATDYGRKSVNPLQIIDANLILPLKLLELGRKYGVKCFMNTDTILDKRVNHYSLSKKQFSDWLMSYKHDLTCINIELEHFYGPGDDKTKFVSFIADSLLKDADKIDLTPGAQKRDFVYIDDAVNAFMAILSNSNSLPKGFYSYQIGSDAFITIKEFVTLMKRLVGNEKTRLNFGALQYRENEVMECSADVTELKKLGWSARYTLEEGLKEMIKQEINKAI